MNESLYNNLLNLSRNKFFYTKIKLDDTFETRLILMFIHFSLMMISTKKKGIKFSQEDYDFLFHNIENNLREIGLGDVNVNKKMKEFNRILYDILLKLETNFNNNNSLKSNSLIFKKYFTKLNKAKNEELEQIQNYFENFYNFCFELSTKNMLKDINKFRF